MNKVNWIQVIGASIVVVLVLFVILSLLPFGWGRNWNGWGSWGMMGPGMMGGWSGMMGGGWGTLGWLFMLVGLLIPLGFLALLVLGSIWLLRQMGTAQQPVAEPVQVASNRTCPSCGQAVQADWQVCPYCGQELA